MIGKCELPRAQPGQGEQAGRERCVQTCALGLLFGSPPWQPVAGSSSSSSRWLFSAQAPPCAGSAGSAAGAEGGGGARRPAGLCAEEQPPARGGPADSPVPRPAIVVTVSRVRETFRAVPFIPGSCLDSEINSKIECACAEARRLRRPGEALSVFRKGFPHGRIYQSQQKGPNSSWLHFTYTQWSYRIQG